MVTKGIKILIVEDEKAMAQALTLKLNHEGFIAQAVFNGKEALDLLKKEKFDLLILDLIMPEANGFDVLESIKKDKIKTKVIVVSNLSQKEDEKKALELGAVDYFIKSNISLSEITNHIKKILKL